MPESDVPRRTTHEWSTTSSLEEGVDERRARAALRLAVVSSLPRPHQSYLFEEIRGLCREFLRNKRISSADVTPEELISEIWKKLVGTVVLHGDKTLPNSNPNEWSVDLKNPSRDGRVVWLIQEIGGATALVHRYEDILRERFGRTRAEGGRPFVQPGIENEPEQSEPEIFEGDLLREADVRNAWHGLKKMVHKEFKASDDVLLVVTLLIDTPHIMENCLSQWPIKDMVVLLNKRWPNPSWNGQRVDNAKRRLGGWIQRLMSQNNLDATDLEALFARVARGTRADAYSVENPHSSNTLS